LTHNDDVQTLLLSNGQYFGDFGGGVVSFTKADEGDGVTK